MCPRCHFGSDRVFSSVRTRHEVKRKETTSLNVPNLIFKISRHNWCQILQYAGYNNVRSLISSNSKMKDGIFDDQFWKKSCEAFLDVDFILNLDNIIILMPRKEIPETWVETYHLIVKKQNWIIKMKKNSTDFLTYLPKYIQLNNHKFGSARCFSMNDVYLMRCLSYQRPDYKETEQIMLKAFKRCYYKLRSGAIAEKLWYISHNDNNTNEIVDNHINYEKNIILCVVITSCYHAIDKNLPQPIMYSDIAEVIYEKKLFHSTLNSITASTDIFSIECVSEQIEMPFELYYII